MGVAIILMTYNGCTRWAASATWCYYYHNTSLKIKHWYDEHSYWKSSQVDGYKYRIKPNAVPWIFPHKESKRPGYPRWETPLAAARHD